MRMRDAGLAPALELHHDHQDPRAVANLKLIPVSPTPFGRKVVSTEAGRYP
jgi:hypothetical protein